MLCSSCHGNAKPSSARRARMETSLASLSPAAAPPLRSHFLPKCPSIVKSTPSLSRINTGFKVSAIATTRSESLNSLSDGLLSLAGKGLATAALTAALHFGPVHQAQATEFNLLEDGPPKTTYVADDAGVLNRVTRSDIKRLLSDLEERTGFHIDLVTLRKLTTKADIFEFSDQLLEKWYPSLEEGNKKGLILLVTTQKEGAVTGGPEFIKTVGDKVLEGVVAENLPVLATDEKYNEALYSTAKRLVAAIDGQPDIPGPKFQETKRESNFKTREQTEEKRGQFTLVVGGLLVIAFVVPMAQYYAYVSKK